MDNDARLELVGAVKRFHLQNPFQPALARYILKEQVAPTAPGFVVDALIQSTPELAVEKGGIRHRTHRIVLNVEEQQARKTIEQAFEVSGLKPPAVTEALRNAGVEEKQARGVLQLLIKEGVLLRVSEDLLFHRSAIDQLCATLQDHRHEEFTVTRFKEWTGISRKYAVPLLEYLDRKRITVRSGDQRKST